MFLRLMFQVSSRSWGHFCIRTEVDQATVASWFAYDFICPILGKLINPKQTMKTLCRHPGDGYPALCVLGRSPAKKGINFQGIILSLGSKASDVFGFTSLLLVTLTLRGFSLLCEVSFIQLKLIGEVDGHLKVYDLFHCALSALLGI